MATSDESEVFRVAAEAASAPAAGSIPRDRFAGGPALDRFQRFAVWWRKRIVEEHEARGSWLAAASAVQHEWLNDPLAPKP